MKIIKFLIDVEDFETVKALFEFGKFVTERNIMTFVDYSIAHTQDGGDMEIQTYITWTTRTNIFHNIFGINQFCKV
ncbi:MAG: hypothetical protein IIY78_08090 [Clostridia bacterium]|nr:hypothetical protein [Clostridia bacterium]